MKKGFMVYCDNIEYLKAMTKEQIANLYLAQIAYASGNEQDVEFFTEDPVVKVAYLILKGQMDADAERAEESRKKRSEAGSKGGSSKASNAKQSVAMLSNAKQCLTQEKERETEKEAEKKGSTKEESNKEIEINKEIYNPPLPPLKGGWDADSVQQKPKKKTALQANRELLEPLDNNPQYTGELKALVRKWMEYKGERGETYKEVGYKTLVNTFLKNIDEFGIDAVEAVVDESITNRYQGILWRGLKTGRKKIDTWEPPTEEDDLFDWS